MADFLHLNRTTLHELMARNEIHVPANGKGHKRVSRWKGVESERHCTNCGTHFFGDYTEACPDCKSKNPTKARGTKLIIRKVYR